jgi:bacillolysin
VGLPAGFFLRSPIGNQTWDFLSGGLDIVAHELSHGVTEFSSNLIYLNESGALNEAFSDIMGTSVEFFFQTPGNASMQADYLIGEDVIRPGGIRSMSNPAAYGDPDHYSKRFRGTEDNGGVHTNSAIASQAFYLAIEGGTNATSGLSVQGVGAANREQIEKVFYRGFTELMPANATFSVARAVTIQAARDLYGAGGNVERAVTEAWTAVGVN